MRSKVTIASQLAAIGTWLLIATPVSSQDYARSGFYAGAGILGGSYTEAEDELEDFLAALGYTASVDIDTAFGFELYGGYRLHPNFAIEAEFEMLPEADFDIDVSGLGTLEGDLETWTFTGNLKAFPLTGRAQPYVLVGIGAMGVDIDEVGDESDFAARFGGGLDFYITEKIVISAGVDYLLPTGDVEDLDYVSFGGGLQYRF